MARLPEVCVRFGQLSYLGLAEAKLFELIDPPQQALANRARLKSLTTLCSAVLHLHWPCRQCLSAGLTKTNHQLNKRVSQ
jgi:hypothetical protein